MDPHEFKMWRGESGLTQSQAATELGISVTALANYEHGRRHGDGKFVVIPRLIERACFSFDRRRELKLRIRDRIQRTIEDGPISDHTLREVLLEIVDAM